MKKQQHVCDIDMEKKKKRKEKKTGGATRIAL
jgi:hypothetical protein